MSYIEIEQRQEQKDPRKQKKGHRCPYRRNGNKGGQKSTQNAADRIVSAQFSGNTTALLQGIDTETYQRGRHCAKQKQGKDKKEKAGNKGGKDK